MKKFKGPGAIARFLVRYRVVLFCSVLVLAVLCALQIPHTNINTDMTKYLPDDYPMRQGMNILEEDLPAMHAQLREFGSVFADGNDLIPKDLPRALITGFSLACVVLMLMCSSIMEVVLFLITIGLAVALNMGTNALLSSVSMMTHMLANILQMVLSMDYCIILMNRFRQEKAFGLTPVAAMENAVSHAAASILSSAFTTIVSLLMLCFMKIKIGADMGVVLAKGVTISLICNFTVLPCLIIWFDKAIEKTRKRPPKLSNTRQRLAAFENRFRVPLAILFVLAFGLFFYLQTKTRTSFSPDWKSAATTEQTDNNDLLLLYADADSTRIPALLDSLKAADPKVTTVLSYPSLVQRQLTAAEMALFFREMAGDDIPVNGELLQLVYYYRTHPERNEMFRLEDLLATVDELRAKGLVDRSIDIGSLMTADEPSSQSTRPGDDEQLEPQLDDNPVVLPQDDTVAYEPQADTSAVSPVTEQDTRFTYEEATTPISAEELAAFAGISKSQANMVYRMAGKAGQKMLPLEVLDFVEANVLTNRRYAAFIPKDAAERLAETRRELLAAIEKGPATELVHENDQNHGRDGENDELIHENGENHGRDGENDELIHENDQNHGRDGIIDAGISDAGVDAGDVAEESPVPPNPLERLAEMVFSRHKYSSTRVYRALSRAGIPVTKEELDLLYLYTGAKSGADPEATMSPEQFLGFVADTLINDPALAPMLPDSLRTAVTSARDSLLSSARILRGKGYSAAVVMSDYEVESDESFDYIDRTQAKADAMLEGPHYWIGGSEMYKELKAAFPGEVLLLTLLTVLAIFLIVAVTFRSVLIPIPLIMTVLTGIYANVWAVGANGETMYFISYLIVQGILMGATIDYTILFTGFYTRSRATMSPEESLAAAYDGSLHSISTSGLILVLVPFAMSFTMSDAMICSILKSISAGAAVVMLLVLFVLPGVLAALDKILIPAKRRAA
ncbi:MAG: MMPL family transporter [Bacteroidales bacterium]|nr:MMPL family transporter [Bacteroidales bacterium]